MQFLRNVSAIWAGLVLLLLCMTVARAEIKELTSPNEAIYFSKKEVVSDLHSRRSTEIAFLGSFTQEKGEEWQIFQQVALEFSKDTGVAVGYTTTKAVYGRYFEENQKIPGVMVFSSFSPENGLIQKGKKARGFYTGSFKYAELHTWFLYESQPLVLRLPENNGPDFQKRMMLAFQSGMPKVFVFGKSPDPAPDALVESAKLFRSKALAIYFSVHVGDEDDEGVHHMKQMGLDPMDVKHGNVAAITYKNSPMKLDFEGDLKNLPQLVQAYLNEQPTYEPEAGAKKGKSPVGKKKKKAAKKDL